MNRLLLCAALCTGSLAGTAQLHLSKLFGDSMVLQRDRPVPVWGWAGPNEKITVQFNKQQKKAVAGPDGRWQVRLDPEAAGGPYELKVTGSSAVQLRGILMGDVWICSGQSNMNFRVNRVTGSQQEIANANYPMIRHFQVNNTIAGEPLDDLAQQGSWKAATPGNTGEFTAVGYFFGRELYQNLKVPIGLIHTSWGGTDIETWISREGFAKDEKLSQAVKAAPELKTQAVHDRWNRAITDRIKLIQPGFPEDVKTQEWKNSNFNDAKWPLMKLPGYWERQQLTNFDGTVWFRKTVSLDAGLAGKEATLELGYIDETDETYINGIKVGSTENNANKKRLYKIPSGVLQAGNNIIAVRVTDQRSNGGFTGDSADMKLVAGGVSTSLAGDWPFQVEALIPGSSAGPNSYPSLLYNGMIHPLIPFAIKGAIWYQGENNTGRSYQYRTAFPMLINDWRKQWHQGDFPFYFVQLASFKANGGNSAAGSSWAELREAQTLTLAVPNTGMAVTTDIGETNDIHPRNKQDVGKRLAAVALHDTYQKNIAYSGPVYQSMKAEGSLVTLNFRAADKGLVTKDGSSTVQGFEIAGADQKFYPAHATIKNNQVVLTAPEVSLPVAVRYAWADDAGTANLFNKEGFPAVPFRTDQWKARTAGNLYAIKP